MTFNEFNRRLNDCHLDRNTKLLLAHMFEVQVNTNRQLNLIASMLDTLTNAMTTFMAMPQAKEKMRALKAEGKEPGVDVQSVPNEPES